MKRLTATLYRSCNALVIVVLLLDVFPPAQNMSSPRFEPPIGHAQEGATTSLEEVLGDPDEADPSSDGPSGQLLVPRMAEPAVVSPGDLITYTIALTNTTGAVDEPEPSANGASGRLLATKVAEPEVVSPGDLVTYTIVLTNTTGVAMEGLVVSDPLPDGLAYMPGSAEGGEYDPRTKTLTWDIEELAAGASVSVSFQARVRGDVLGELVVNLAEVTGGGLADPVQAQATVAVVSRALITPQGGMLVSRSGRVRVEFPGGAVPHPIWAIYRLREVHQLPPSQPGLALRFDLTAEVATDENTAPPFTQFQKPVRLTVDMTELVDEAALGQYQRPFVGYLDEATSRWVHLPVLEQQVGPVLTVEVDHFSTFGGGVEGSTDNEGWRLLYNEPQVALFSGAAVYNYPIQVPPGRGGLQPALNLSYNSRRVDGVTNWVESGWAGMGWSVDLMDIVREGLETVVYSETVFIRYENLFTLLMNGTGYELEPAPGVAAGQSGRYHVKDAPYLYVELTGGGDNVTGLYWIVKTPDGTRHQLGYTTNSEQVVWPAEGAEEYVTYRWRLDEAVDVYSNTMQVTYREAQGGHLERRDTASVLHEIKYNSMGEEQWATEVIFNPDPGGHDFGSQPGDEDRRIFGSQGQLDRIEVRHDGQRVRYYDLGYHTTPTTPTIRSLVSIQQFSGDGGQSLPATAFDYEDKWNKGKCDPEANPNCTEWDIEAFPYPRLVQVDNGYGGIAEFDYETDGRGGSWTFYNYRVKARRIYDGIDTAPVQTITYTYGKMCYDQTTEDPANYPTGAVTCTGRSAPYLGPLVGHDWVTETLYSDDIPLVETAHRFYIDTDHSWRLGREYQTQIHSGQGDLLHETDTTWGSTPISNTTFAHVDEVLAEDYSGAETVSTRVDYTYDNYGNLTRQREYANGETQNPYRTSRWEYWPNEVDHIVDRVASAGVYVGGGWDLAASTWYFYDGNASPTQSPGSKGELTRVMRLEVIDLGEVPGEEWPDCVHAYRTSEVEYDYDDYGNLITETTYADYGYMCQDSDWNMLPRDMYGEPFLFRTTQTFYDSTYHQFPITVTNVQGYISTIEYYGVNDSECIGAGYHFGAVCRTYGPNGPDTATLYTYDPFGRLTKVIRPGDSEAMPTVEYWYDDAYNYGGLQGVKITRIVRERSGIEGAVQVNFSFYDGLGRLVETLTERTNGAEQVLAYTTYDALGRVKEEYVPYVVNSDFWNFKPLDDPNRPHTTTDYDALGRVVWVVNPDGTSTRTYYQGWKTAVIDTNDHQKIYENDAFGRLVTVREFNGTYPGDPGWTNTPYATTTYTYSVLGNLTTVTDTTLSNVTTMEYDMLGRKTQMTDPDMGTWSYDYDAAGNLTHQTDALSQTIVFEYDQLNRLVRKQRAGGSLLAEYGYDGGTYGIGYRTVMIDGTKVAEWAYDERGRVVEETRQFVGIGAYTTGYTYDAMDRMVTMTYPDGEVVTATHNAMGLPETLTSSLGETYVASASYRPEGRLNVLELGSGLQVDHDYYDWDIPNGQGRLQRLYADGLQDLRYSYDAVGNVTQIQDVLAGETLDFSYDALDRLLGASGEYSESYGYNEIGNLTLKDGLVYEYDPDHPHAVKYRKLGDAVQDSFGYDPNGNMTSRTVDDIAYTLAYDTENRLNSVTQGGRTTTFTYDGDGRRVRRDTVTDTIIYVGSHYEVRFEEGDMPEDLNGDCLVTVVDIMLVVARWGMTSADPDWDSRYDLDGNEVIDIADIMLVAVHWRETCEELAETVKYYTLGGRRVAMRKERVGETDALYYLFRDHLGSSNVSYRADGQQTIIQRYYPWGTIRPGPDNALPTDYTFTGQKLDESTGLMYYGARYYDPALGRFISADPIVPEPGNPQALNRYAYVYNNPLRYIDPTGYLTEEQIMAHFRVETWEEVLAFFGAGGELEGRWGWLEVLREVELGDKVQVLEGWPTWSFGTVDDSTIFSGTLVDRDGQLFIQSGRSLVPANVVGQWGNAYYTAHRSSVSGYYGGRQIYAGRKSYHLKWDPNRVDWVDAGIDVFGIIGDVAALFPPYGTAIWLISEVPELLTVGKAWDQLETGDPSDVLVDLGVAAAQSAKLLPEGGSVANVFSLLVNLSKGVYFTP